MTDRLGWPFTPGHKIKIVRAEGVYLHTVDGNKLLDAAGGAIVSNVGHGRARVADAVREATLETSYVVPPWLTPGRERLTEQLANWLPKHLARAHLTSGGSEANEAAMKLALQYQWAVGDKTRTKIITRDISYHGTTLATAAASGHAQRKRGLEDALPYFPTAAAPYPLRCPVGAEDPDCSAYYVQALESTIAREGAHTIAALIAEPIIGSSGGAIVPPADYWPAVRAICDEHGILLIADEVMTGFGRTGAPFASEALEMHADILVAGKGLAGGYAPLGGVFATEAVGNAIDQEGLPVMFNTFGAHPAACAAAAEVLAILDEEDLVQRADTTGKALSGALHASFDQHPFVAEVRGRGLLQAIEIVRDRETLERFPAEASISQRVVARGLHHGVFFYGGGTGDVRDIVCMGPAFTIERSEIEQMVTTLLTAVDETITRYQTPT